MAQQAAKHSKSSKTTLHFSAQRGITATATKAGLQEALPQSRNWCARLRKCRGHSKKSPWVSFHYLCYLVE